MAAAIPFPLIIVGNLQKHHWHDPSHIASEKMVTYLGLIPGDGVSTAGLVEVRFPPKTDKILLQFVSKTYMSLCNTGPDIQIRTKLYMRHYFLAWLFSK